MAEAPVDFEIVYSGSSTIMSENGHVLVQNKQSLFFLGTYCLNYV
jgi:hypothetical protein